MITTRHQAVLDEADEQPFSEMVAFQQLDEDTGELDEQYLMTADMYEELGRPDQITISVTPGDRLNDGSV